MNIFLYSIIFVLGLCLGSFLNAWICRTRSEESILKGRSMCPHCHATLQAEDLIPLVSFLLLHGKCRMCQKKIDVQYFLVELVTGILFLTLALLSFHGGAFLTDTLSLVLLLRNGAILFFLEFIFIYDFLYQEIPWKITFGPGIIYFIFSLLFHWNSLLSMLFGIAIGAGFFLVQYVVSKGAWIGGGDIGMGFLMGAVLGWPYILIALFLSYVGGTLFILPFLLLKKMDRKTAIPFGTFLSVATFFVMMWGEKIFDLLYVTRNY
jgi:leader peptidase (prepilin peptidase)/N-methyltransferase